MNAGLHLAVTNGHLAIAKLLVESDPSDTHVQDGKVAIVKMICTTCNAPFLYGPQGTTALHADIMNLAQESGFRLLRDYQRLITYADSSRGWTPLHVAAKNGHISTVIRLMQLLPLTCADVDHEFQNILQFAVIKDEGRA